MIEKISNYVIEDLSVNNERDWEAFNEKICDGSFFHTLKWKKILEQLNYKSHYFLVYDKHEVISICPFFEGTIKGFKGLMLLPTSDHRHLLIDKTKCDHPLVQEILHKVKEISKRKKYSFILITTKNEEIITFFNKFNPMSFPLSGTMVLDLKKDNPKKIWNDIFSKKEQERKYIRRFEEDGFKIQEIKSLENLRLFYKYYKENTEYIKAIPFRYTHFEALWNTYSPNDIRITFLHKNGLIAGGELSFIYPPKKTMYLRYLAINRTLPNRYQPTLYLRWNSVIHASDMGYDTVNFGGTPCDPNDIHYKLKMKFGCHYEKEYSIVFPLSPLFKLGYTAYRFFK